MKLELEQHRAVALSFDHLMKQMLRFTAFGKNNIITEREKIGQRVDILQYAAIAYSMLSMSKLTLIEVSFICHYFKYW